MKFGYGFIIVMHGMYLSALPAAQQKNEVVYFNTRHQLAKDQWYSIPYKVKASGLHCLTSTPSSNPDLEIATAVITDYDTSVAGARPNVITVSKHKTVTLKNQHYAPAHSYKAFYRFTDVATKKLVIGHIANNQAEELYKQITELAEARKSGKAKEVATNILSLINDINDIHTKS